MTPLVSVIVPTFNRAYCLLRTIDSALGQTYGHLEVIVVDDGSTDDTRSLLERTYGQDRRVRYVYQHNCGVSGARNHGIRESRGSYVAFLDSDDIWKPWKVEIQVACLASRSIGMVWSEMEAIDPAGNVFSNAYLREMYSAYRWWREEDLFSGVTGLLDIVPGHASVPPEAVLYTGDIFSQMVMGSLVHTSTVMLTRKRLERVGGFDESLRFSGEDYDFHLRTCREGPVGLISLPTIQYQRGMPDRLTRPEFGPHLASNFLRTVQRVLDRDRARINLPNWMKAAVLAEAHAWVAELALETGRRALARRHFLQSLRHQVYQPRTLGLLVAATLPRGAGAGLRRCVSAVKRGIPPPRRLRGEYRG